MAKKLLGSLKLQVPAGAANPVSANRPRSRSARHQHHGILQGVQRPYGAGTEGHAPSRGDHVSTQDKIVHLRDQDAAGVLLPEASGRRSRPAPSFRAATTPARCTMDQCRGDRQEEDSRTSTRTTWNARRQDHRRLCPRDGSSRSQERKCHGNRKTHSRRSQGRRPDPKLYKVTDAVKIVKGNAKAKFDETIDDRRQPRHRPGTGGPERPWRRRPASRNRRARFASLCSRATRKPTKPAPLALTSSRRRRPVRNGQRRQGHRLRPRSSPLRT